MPIVEANIDCKVIYLYEKIRMQSEKPLDQ